MDDVALEKRFGPFGHLYEGNYGDDVEQGREKSFEIDEGDEGDIADLEALVTASTGTEPADFSDRVQPYADLAEMTKMWAVEHYVGHWDSYATLNNYYLLSDPAGRFQMLPWGTDQTWTEHMDFNEGNGRLFRACLEDASCEDLYRESLRQIKAPIAAIGLDRLATEIAALLKPWEEMEQANARHEFALPAVETAVQGTRHFIATRVGELTRWLRDQPEVFATDIDLVLTPASLPADGKSVSVATATVADAQGIPVPGDTLEFTSSDPAARFGEVIDNDDGTYSVAITASSVVGSSTITVRDTWPNPDLVDSAVLTQTPEAPTHLSLKLQPSSIVADGNSAATATAFATDAHDNPVPGESLEFTSTDSGQQLGGVIDHHDGSYSVKITSSTLAGPATIAVSDPGPNPDLVDSAVLTQTPGVATDVSLKLEPGSVPADGASSAMADATVVDANGNPVPGDLLEFSSSDPADLIGPVVDLGGGLYAAEITSSVTPGSVTITATDASAGGVSGAATLIQSSTSPPIVAPDPPSGTQATTIAPNEPLGSLVPPPMPKLTGRPSRRTHDRRPTFRFVSDQPGATFQCRLDRQPFRPCGSPYTLGRIGPGAHTFSVRAIGPSGLIGLPTSFRFVLRSASARRQER